ncbi:unnamed protein product [Orchesella dallaii]|uniref:Uncharacterized protein n=1 Tax=Orchesella dallaii TaxID=48710 RepID=A0ABP1RPM7_9HEXA
MKCSLFKVPLIADEAAAQKREEMKMEAESRRLFQVYCIQNGIPFLSEQEGVIPTTNYGTRQHRPYWKKKGKTRWETPEVEQRPSEQNSGSTANWSRGKGNTEGLSASGGGGGGERPPPPSSSEPESAWSFSDDDSTTDASERSRKRRKLKERGRQKDTPQNEDNAAVKRAKLPVSPLNKISIRSYGVTGKLEKISKIDKNIQPSLPKLPEKLVPPPPPPRKIQQTQKRKTVTIEEPPKRLPSIPIIIKIRNSIDIDKLFSTEDETGQELLEEEPEAPPKKRKSSDTKWHRRASRRTIPLIQHPTLIRTMEDVKEVISSERDKEWLQCSSSDEAKDKTGGVTNSSKRKTENDPKTQEPPTIHPQLQMFITSIRFLTTISSILGLSPYTNVIRSNNCIQVKWVPRSCSYIFICLNALLFFTVTLSIFSSLLAIFGYEDPMPTTKQIVKVEFALHFLESVFLMLFTLFLSIWSISCVLEMGAHYAEFYSRFNMAICLTQYDITDNLDLMIKRHLRTVLVFEGMLVVFFFGGRLGSPIARENCGFLGYLLVRPFNFEVRESVYYPLVEVLGMVVLLYCFLCLNVVLLQFAVYSKALGNMARQFNIRLAYTLESVTQRYSIAVGKWSSKVIPYDKLYAEHLIVASLFRNISHVNGIVFGTYIFVMIFEIVLVMWLFFDVFLEVHLESLENVLIERTGSVVLAVPLRLQQWESERLLRSFLIFVVTWSTYWVFGGVLHNAGELFHTGVTYIRRHGMLRCRSMKEKRFIMSLIVSFTQKSPIWIGSRFNFNRAFLTSLMGFVIGASMVTISFRPERTSLSSIETCMQTGSCAVITLYKSAQHILYATIDDAVPPSAIKPPGGPILPDETTPTLPAIELDKLYHPPIFFLQEPPCESAGIYPWNDSLVIYKCPAGWPFLSELKLPYFYKPVTFGAKQNLLYGKIKEPFKARDSEVTNRCRKANVPIYNFPYPKLFGRPPAGPIVDCFGNNLDDQLELDDCGNPAFDTTMEGRPSQKISPVVRAVSVSALPSVPFDGIVCCYEYLGYKGSEKQVKACNTPNSEVFLEVCQLTAENRPRMRDNPHVLQHYDRISTRLRFELDKGGGGREEEFLKVNQDVIRNCLCRLKDPQVALDSEEHCQCTGLYLLPCVPPYFEEVYPEDYAVTCEPIGGDGPNKISVQIPLLFKTNSDRSLVFYGEHTRYKDDCAGEDFRDRFNHDDSLSYSASPCATAPAPPTPIRLDLVDCAGNPIVLGDLNKDDCSNWKISLPNHLGKMIKPRISIRSYYYNIFTQEVFDLPTPRMAFLCCFQYQGDVFRTPHQDRYCNAPGLETMNKEKWCKTMLTLNNGKRQPSGGFSKEKTEQLQWKLQLAVNYYAAKQNRKWLEDSKVNEKWSKCICPDKIEGFTQSQHEKARLEECKPLIPTPLELHSVGVLKPEVFPLCEHGWPSTVTLIGTPAVFTFVNEFWEVSERFEERGSSPPQLSYCHSNNSYDERYSNNGNPQLYDISLKKLPVGETDDCWNLPVPTPKSPKESPEPPKLRLVSEFGMNLLQPGLFPESTSAHCCYKYEGFSGNQLEVCNMPDGDAVKRKCGSKPISSQRKMHEKELVRGMMVAKYGAEFKGNRVPPFDLSWDGQSEKTWKQCICGKGSASQPNNEKCQGKYLPPCVIPKGTQNHFILEFPDTFTTCPSTWSGGGHNLPLRVPILMGFNEKLKTFKKRGYNDGSHCPNEKNSLDLSTSNTILTDCYGQDISTPVALDHCGNPSVSSPLLSSWATSRSPPQIQLIALNQLQDFSSGGTNDERFFCCWKYALSEENQVNICNMPSKPALERKCKFSVPKELTKYVEDLKMERASGNSDVLASSVPFTDPMRVLWTNCICKREMDECKKIVLFPHCFNPPPGTSPQKQMFTECHVPPNSGGRWKTTPSIFQPTIFQKKNNEYIQIMLFGASNCLVGGGDPPFPPSTSPTYDENEPIFDCQKKEYIIPTEFDVDDCSNPIMKKKPGSYLPYQSVSAIVEPEPNSKIVSCCVAYGVPSKIEGEQLAVLCNMPSRVIYKNQCRPRKHQADYPSSLSKTYHDVWNSLVKDVRRVMEKDSKIVQCLCRHLTYVKEMDPNFKLKERQCRDYILTWKIKG